jgi:hypothetical protein
MVHTLSKVRIQISHLLSLPPADNTNYNLFSAGDAVVESSGGTPVTSAITTTATIDGTWNNSSELSSAYDWNDVFFGSGQGADSAAQNGKFVAVGYGSGSSRLYNSSDGINWASQGSQSNFLTAGCFGNGKWVIVGSAAPGNVVYSSNTTSWTAVTATKPSNGANAGSFNAVVYGTRYVAVGSGLMYSSDAANWTVVEGNSTIDSVTWYDIIYGNGLYVAAGSGKFMTSTNGTTSWTSITSSDISSATWRAIAYGNGTFVAVSASVPTILYSTNGTTWTATAAPVDGSTAKYKDVTFGDGKFVAICSGGNFKTISSTDGITWVGNKDSLSGSWPSITYGNPNTFDGKFVMVADSGSNRLQWSLSGTGALQPQLTLTNNTNLANFRVGDSVSASSVATSGTDFVEFCPSVYNFSNFTVRYTKDGVFKSGLQTRYAVRCY